MPPYRGDSGQMAMQLPRPGPVLKVVLVALLVVGISGALAEKWVGLGVLHYLACGPEALAHYRIWTLVTSGVLTLHWQPLLFTLLGLYFLSPDLETRWGGRRFALFLAASVAAGNLLVIAVDQLPFLTSGIFHPPAMFGASAAITAIGVAWARERPETEIRLMFFLPIKGKHLLWISLGFCVLCLIYQDGITEGVMAPFGGFLVGLGLAGSPSILRRTYLQMKLAILKRQAGPRARTGRISARKPRPAGGPELRVLPGGLEEELRKREPPKDKRYLN